MSTDPNIAKAIEELTVWRSSWVRLHTDEHTTGTGIYRATLGSLTEPLVKFPELTKASDHDLQIQAASEPELKEACAALYTAIENLHKAREAVIERKARELASLIYQDEISTIQKAVQAIGGTP